MNCEKDIVLAEVVRRYLALYEKTCKDYHRRDVKKRKKTNQSFNQDF